MFDIDGFKQKLSTARSNELRRPLELAKAAEARKSKNPCNIHLRIGQIQHTIQCKGWHDVELQMPVLCKIANCWVGKIRARKYGYLQTITYKFANRRTVEANKLACLSKILKVFRTMLRG